MGRSVALQWRRCGTIVESSSTISGVDVVGRVPNQNMAGTLPDPCDMSALAIV